MMVVELLHGGAHRALQRDRRAEVAGVRTPTWVAPIYRQFIAARGARRHDPNHSNHPTVWFGL